MRHGLLAHVILNNKNQYIWCIAFVKLLVFILLLVSVQQYNGILETRTKILISYDATYTILVWGLCSSSDNVQTNV